MLAVFAGPEPLSLTANLVVLNFNGRELLERFVPSWVRAVQESAYPCRLTILDNASTDGSREFMRSQYPKIEWVDAPENKVLSSYNAYAKHVHEDILIFLNNDIETKPGFINPLVDPFVDNPDVFFVATHGDCPVVKERWGVLSAELEDAEYKERCRSAGYSLSAGVGAFHRQKFLELGGYDELYLPGRYEDMDLCYRGWKKGWLGIYAPKSEKYHVGGASFEKHFSSRQTQKLVFRNGILFTLKNITDKKRLLKFFVLTSLRVIVSALLLRWQFVSGFLEAGSNAPEALRARKRAKKDFTLTDEEVLKKYADCTRAKK